MMADSILQVKPSTDLGYKVNNNIKDLSLTIIFS